MGRQEENFLVMLRRKRRKSVSDERDEVIMELDASGTEEDLFRQERWRRGKNDLTGEERVRSEGVQGRYIRKILRTTTRLSPEHICSFGGGEGAKSTGGGAGGRKKRVFKS